MMNLLRRAVEKADPRLVAELIQRRLAGDPLDIPANIGAMEGQRDAIIALYHHRNHRSVIDAALDILSIPLAMRRVRKITRDPDFPARLEWLLEFFALLSDLKNCVPGSARRIVCTQTMALPWGGERLTAVHLAAFRALASCPDESEPLVGQVGQALAHTQLAAPLSLLASDVAPTEFLRDIAPQLMLRLGKRRDLDASDFGFLSTSLHNAINAIIAQGADPWVSGLDEFISGAADQAPHYQGSNIRRAVVSALSKTSLPFEIIQRFEREYWNRHDDVILEQDKELDHALRVLQQRVTNLQDYTAVRPMAFTVNPIPYAEAGYFYLWALLLDEGWDIEAYFHLTEYNNVLKSLCDGKLQVAIHNNFFLRQPVRLPSNRTLLQSQPLINFTTYEALASRRKLEHLIRTKKIDGKARDLARSIASGIEIEQEDISSAHDALGELVELGGLTYSAYTDTEFAARKLFGDIGRTHIKDALPDEGMRRLLDGETLFYVGGALQAHYALNSCSSRVLKVADIDLETSVHFFMFEDVYNQAPAEYDRCVYLWETVNRLWPELVKPQIAPEDLQPLYSELKRKICFEINRGRKLRSGFAPTFSDLAEILAGHDISLNPDFTRDAFEPAPVGARQPENASEEVKEGGGVPESERSVLPFERRTNRREVE